MFDGDILQYQKLLFYNHPQCRQLSGGVKKTGWWLLIAVGLVR